MRRSSGRQAAQGAAESAARTSLRSADTDYSGKEINSCLLSVTVWGRGRGTAFAFGLRYAGRMVQKQYKPTGRPTFVASTVPLGASCSPLRRQMGKVRKWKQPEKSRCASCLVVGLLVAHC